MFGINLLGSQVIKFQLPMVHRDVDAIYSAAVKVRQSRLILQVEGSLEQLAYAQFDWFAFSQTSKSVAKNLRNPNLSNLRPAIGTVIRTYLGECSVVRYGEEIL